MPPYLLTLHSLLPSSATISSPFSIKVLRGLLAKAADVTLARSCRHAWSKMIGHNYRLKADSEGIGSPLRCQSCHCLWMHSAAVTSTASAARGLMEWGEVVLISIGTPGEVDWVKQWRFVSECVHVCVSGGGATLHLVSWGQHFKNWRIVFFLQFKIKYSLNMKLQAHVSS